MARKRVKRVGLRPYAFGCVLGLALAAGLTYGSYKAQSTYVLVERADIEHFVAYVNGLLMQCRMSFHSS